jgi:hypothetical protein
MTNVLIGATVYYTDTLGEWVLDVEVRAYAGSQTWQCVDPVDLIMMTVPCLTNTGPPNSGYSGYNPNRGGPYGAIPLSCTANPFTFNQTITPSSDPVDGGGSFGWYMLAGGTCPDAPGRSRTSRSPSP